MTFFGRPTWKLSSPWFPQQNPQKDFPMDFWIAENKLSDQQTFMILTHLVHHLKTLQMKGSFM